MQKNKNRVIQPFWLESPCAKCHQKRKERWRGERVHDPPHFPPNRPCGSGPERLSAPQCQFGLLCCGALPRLCVRSAPLSATGMLSGVLADVTLRVRGRRRLAVTVDAHVGAGKGFGVWWEACLRLTRRGRRRLAVTVDAPGAARCPHRRPLE